MCAVTIHGSLLTEFCSLAFLSPTSPPQLQNSEWAPDFGPARFVPRWGASVVGARHFLIAYNVNILGTKEQAHRIALAIRESGKGAHKVATLSL